jgi:hypothetical protein
MLRMFVSREAIAIKTSGGNWYVAAALLKVLIQLFFLARRSKRSFRDHLFYQLFQRQSLRGGWPD